MITLSQIISRVRTRYEAASGGSTVRFTDADITKYINEGLATLAEATGFYERYCTVTLMPGQNYYDLRGFTNEVVVGIKSMFCPSRNSWLTPYNDVVLPYDWDISVGDPQVFFPRGIYWFGIYPVPREAVSVRVHFSGIPSPYIHTQAVLGDLPNDYVPALEDYALYEMAGIDGNAKQALLHYADYDRREKSLARFIDKRSSGARAGRIGSLYGRL